MSYTPMEWRKVVIEHYGSIAAFGDPSTVEIIRTKISEKRCELKTMLDLETTHPGVVAESDLKKMKAEDAELAALDEELIAWQTKRKGVSA